MKTVTVQIGNSDDKLSQSRYALFVGEVDAAIRQSARDIHFFGGPPTYSRWQNTAWVFEIEQANIADLCTVLYHVRETFEQDSIAWTEGTTVFV